MDRTLSRQLVCTGIFFVRSGFLAFLSSVANGAWHQHSKLVRKSYSAYKLIELNRHMKHPDGHQPKSSWYITEMVALRSNKNFPCHPDGCKRRALRLATICAQNRVSY
jgi:hypothetical protein